MIIVTAGPNLFAKGVVSELCKQGLQGIRIPAAKQPPREQIDRILSELSADAKIIVDFPGGKFRLNNPGNFRVLKDDILRLSNDEKTYDYTGKLCVYPQLIGGMNVGEILIVGDGETAFTVMEANEEEIIVKVERDAVLGPRKGITPNNKNMKLAILTEHDYGMMECLAEEKISGIMLSFVETSEDVQQVKDYIRDQYGRSLEIYAKIETEKGIENLEAIAQVADYLVLARGDLLITVGEEKFPVCQQQFLEKMRATCEKAIIATELAHSLGHSYLMSRAELTFLYLLGSMGYEKLMLASETTVLCDPVKVFEKVSKLMKCYSK